MSPAFDLDVTTARWRKSSYSNPQGGECVEIGGDFPGAALWRTSSHSDAIGGDCVEVADGLVGVVPVRDSKAPGRGALVFGAPAWAAFVTALRRREGATRP